MVPLMMLFVQMLSGFVVLVVVHYRTKAVTMELGGSFPLPPFPSPFPPFFSTCDHGLGREGGSRLESLDFGYNG